MRKVKDIKIKYVYVEPKTPEEKAEQERILEKVYFGIFDRIYAKKLAEKKKNLPKSEV